MFENKPIFVEPKYVGRPNIGDRAVFIERINDILDSRWLTNHGKYVKEFEDRLAEFVGAKHAVVMTNGTVAIEVLTRALGMTGEVIVPSATFVATAHALQWQGITPVFCDIDSRTHNIDPGQVEELITPRTTGIIGVHLWGRPCDIQALEHISLRHNLKLVFDSSHALGCSYKGDMIGGFGIAETFSFHATKVVNSCEGGALVTNDNELARQARLMTNFGFRGYDKVDYIGINGKMNEMSAAMGLTSLEAFDAFVDRNRANYHVYRDRISQIPGLQMLSYNETEKNNFHYIVVEVDESITGISRDHIIDILHKENILARRYFYPGCHRMEPYRSYFPHANLLLPRTEWVLNRVLVLPTGTAITETDIHKICDLLVLIVTHGPEISRRLRD
ncbi:aminotransferase class I/II-fold pyridoxal phosphate-dependent enzyme [Gammaproteobacteria bacterium]|nr:aminotransferase class I/II-fold pyridoxal phosphate-dependent enzyme [Gammaproteobacteria bacterium]